VKVIYATAEVHTQMSIEFKKKPGRELGLGAEDVDGKGDLKDKEMRKVLKTHQMSMCTKYNLPVLVRNKSYSDGMHLIPSRMSV